MTIISAFAGQHVAGKVVKKLGKASFIIFILAFTVFVSSLTLGMYHSHIHLLCLYLSGLDMRFLFTCIVDALL